MRAGTETASSNLKIFDDKFKDALADMLATGQVMAALVSHTHMHTAHMHMHTHTHRSGNGGASIARAHTHTQMHMHTQVRWWMILVVVTGGLGKGWQC